MTPIRDLEHLIARIVLSVSAMGLAYAALLKLINRFA